MLKIVQYSEMVVAVLLAISILLQNRGAGLSSAFGGDFGGYYSKRGLEKFLLHFSVIASFIFIALAIAILVITGKQ